jgi:hypothetical protein
MRKKLIIVSHLPGRLPNNPTKRILLSRETIRTLTPDELSRAGGADGDGIGGCNTGSTRGEIEIGG